MSVLTRCASGACMQTEAPSHASRSPARGAATCASCAVTCNALLPKGGRRCAAAAMARQWGQGIRHEDEQRRLGISTEVSVSALRTSSGAVAAMARRCSQVLQRVGCPCAKVLAEATGWQFMGLRLLATPQGLPVTAPWQPGQ